MAVSQFEDSIAAIRAVALECGAFLVNSAPTTGSEDGAVPFAGVDHRTFVDLVRHVRPRIVYLVVMTFDAEVEAELTIATDDERIFEHRKFKKFIAKWRQRDGQLNRIIFGLMCDGVLHGNMETAGWVEEFEREAAALESDLEADLD